MGFIDTSADETLPVFYNVVHAVGRLCPNLPNDVKLVQYLLIAFYDKSEESGLGWKRPPGELTVTGICNTTTMNWIQQFQTDIRKGLGKGTLDGRIDRVRNKDLVGSISRTTYTLAFLNRGVLNFNPQAFVMTPKIIPLENPLNIPPPSNDMVRQPPKGSPTSRVGGA